MRNLRNKTFRYYALTRFIIAFEFLSRHNTIGREFAQPQQVALQNRGLRDSRFKF